jgi:hypothetical protein
VKKRKKMICIKCASLISYLGRFNESRKEELWPLMQACCFKKDKYPVKAISAQGRLARKAWEEHLRWYQWVYGKPWPHLARAK